MRRLESRPAYFYANADLSTAYRNHVVQRGAHKERDNPAAKHVEREYVFIRDLETLVIFDRLEASPVGDVPAENIKKTFLAHCEVDWTLEDGQRSTCTNGPQAMRLTTLVPSSTTRAVTHEGGGSGQYRLEVTASGAPQTYFLHVLQAKAREAPSLSPVVSDVGRSYVVTLDHGHSITFDKGMTSSGGSITVRGQTTRFRADVQSMSVTDDGPLWHSP
jgi:hypothetical protein